ncbi:MAG TPA: AraC family transcriptional regulator [Reyranella sp.]|jgi:AraC-like DNA-binding protein|nr:AraC family transcriptional regulator [Reyranella sp.]
MDALSDVLRATQLSGGVFLQAEFTAPWCVTVNVTTEFCAPFLGPATHLIPYHYVVEGELHTVVEGGSRRRLGSGELVLFPRNDGHVLGSDPSLPPVRAADIIVPSSRGELASIHHGGGGTATRMICGFLGCDSVQGNPLVETLPAVMILKVEEAGPAEWIRSTFQYAAQQVASGLPGSTMVLAKLSELLFVEAVRRYVEDLPVDQAGWLAGLRDPVVARTLALLHGNIARAWSVEELGRQAGMSRSALADRFTRLIGMAPMHYLAHWRMQTAAQKLRGSNASLAQVAELAGYDSEAAFSRAFKKAFGSAPATWRRAARG